MVVLFQIKDDAQQHLDIIFGENTGFVVNISTMSLKAKFGMYPIKLFMVAQIFSGELWPHASGVAGSTSAPTSVSLWNLCSLPY